MIRKAIADDANTLAALAVQLWKEHSADELAQEFWAGITNGSTCFFLAYDRQTPIGFAQCQLRHDYVEGTQSSPVGYLEGIFVAESFRRQGVAKALLNACEAWARTQGCHEFASDCELTNADSLQFHLGLGFTEANRIICFTKKL